MARPVDPAILAALEMDNDGSAAIIPHERSRFDYSYELFGYIRGTARVLLIKIGTGMGAEVRFKGEHTALRKLWTAEPYFCPNSYAYGEISQLPGRYFLVTDYLDVMLGHRGGGSPYSIAAKLARVHSARVPIPEGFDRPMFGFPVTTFCGKIPQDNSWKQSWATFYSENRLRSICRMTVHIRGPDHELERGVEMVINRVVPRLIGNFRYRGYSPVLLHGNLTFQNRTRGQLLGKPGVEEIALNPASFYGHAEYDLGAARVYGFPPLFFEDYHRYIFKEDPKEEWHDRLALYELYHRLVIYATYGGDYRDRAMSTMRTLILKYGEYEG